MADVIDEVAVAIFDKVDEAATIDDTVFTCIDEFVIDENVIDENVGIVQFLSDERTVLNKHTIIYIQHLTNN